MRIRKKFIELKKKKQKALMPFIVIGDPDYKTSLEIAKSISKHADLLELGMPFSDPIADGPTIQSADVRALNKKINTDTAFRFIRELRKHTQIPIGLLVYYNLVYQRGINKFYKDAKSAGVDSIVIADMSVEESKDVIKASRKNKVDSVFMVSPLTDNKRTKKILKKTTGFVYVVSRLGITGARNYIDKAG